MDTKKLRQKILDLAIHGKLVPQDPNDEPASVLLEHIRSEKERLIKEGKIKRSRKTTKTSDAACDKQEVPFEVPSGWVWTTLGEISNYGSSQNEQVKDIQDDSWILELEDIKRETADIIQYLSKKDRRINGVRHKFSEGDILYSKLRTYLNKVLVAPKGGFCTTEIMPLNTYGGISNKYVCNVLRSPYFLGYTQNCVYGVKMPRLSTTDACKGPIPLPPLAEQQRIVEEIERWFKLIDIIEQGKADLQSTIKQAKNKILDLAIHGKLVPQDPNDEPASELLKRINPKAEITCDNGHYPKLPYSIPYNWVWVPHNNIINIIGGAQPLKSQFREYFSDGYIRLYQIRDYGESPLPVYIPIETATKQTKKGDILLARYGASLGKVFRAEAGAYNVAMAKASVKYFNLIDENYLYFFYLSNIYQEKILSISRTAQAGFNNGDFVTMFFPLPPLTEQRRIAENIEHLFIILKTIEENL